MTPQRYLMKYAPVLVKFHTVNYSARGISKPEVTDNEVSETNCMHQIKNSE
jgi:hypothetical protein